MQDCTSTCNGRETVPSTEEQAYLNKYKTQTDGLSCYTNRSVWLCDLDLKQAERKKLQSFETKCSRKILGVTWHEHITNKEVLSRSSRAAGYLLNRVLLRQRVWLSHVLRIQGQRLPKMSLQAHHQGPRRRGRPRKKWSEAVLEGSSITFIAAVHLAHNREMWRIASMEL